MSRCWHVLLSLSALLVLAAGRVIPEEEWPAELEAANNDAVGNFQLESAMAQLEAQQREQAAQQSAAEEDADALMGNALDGGDQQEEAAAAPTENGGDINNEMSSVLQLPANIGHVAGLALDAQSRLVLFHRSGRVWNDYSFDGQERLNSSLGAIPNATIAVLDKDNGNLVEEHGAGTFYMPHGLTIDAEGNLWLTDVGSHQVHKLDKQFRPLMTLGEKMVPGSDNKHFCKPTDVAVASTGEFFIADGYCNSRIMKFDRDGNLLSQFGHPNSEEPPKNGEFFVPHSIALIENLNLLCVADRENERIQCFSAGLEGSAAQRKLHRRAYVPTGTFVTKAENIGRVFAIREKEHFLTGVTSPDRNGQLEPQVFVMDMNTGRANTFAKGLENAHAIALSDNGDIFVSQLEPNQIVKFSVPPNTEATVAQEQ